MPKIALREGGWRDAGCTGGLGFLVCCCFRLGFYGFLPLPSSFRLQPTQAAPVAATEGTPMAGHGVHSNGGHGVHSNGTKSRVFLGFCFHGVHSNGGHGVHSNGGHGVHSNGPKSRVFLGFCFRGSHSNGGHGVHSNGGHGVHSNGCHGMAEGGPILAKIGSFPRFLPPRRPFQWRPRSPFQWRPRSPFQWLPRNGGRRPDIGQNLEFSSVFAPAEAIPMAATKSIPMGQNR